MSGSAASEIVPAAIFRIDGLCNEFYINCTISAMKTLEPDYTVIDENKLFEKKTIPDGYKAKPRVFSLIVSLIIE